MGGMKSERNMNGIGTSNRVLLCWCFEVISLTGPFEQLPSLPGPRISSAFCRTISSLVL